MKMKTQWKMYLDQTTPPGAVVDFSAAAFVLQVAMNLRISLSFVEATPECHYLAERIMASAELYGHAREAGSTLAFTDAEKALAEAVALLAIELQHCPSASHAVDASLTPMHPAAASQPTTIESNPFGHVSL
ncbi:hypothetical protein QA646_23715 (plasmid) [Rhizobium sp. CB3090]|uniref:hypothetical protein n=1 Tax=Rhizobium sp. CB3090 TaxID=3039156 RepID=UPI0024B221E2|nr:hypothetical protein [Rhizobium sp. CB3090]WFU11410.1 hypothetical protein QA646_23715 [Rhizobium sp. CB3090]